jgi:hypothetical protein
VSDTQCDRDGGATQGKERMRVSVSANDGAAKVETTQHRSEKLVERWQPLDAAAVGEPNAVTSIRAFMEEAGDRLLAHDPAWLSGAEIGEQPARPAPAVVYLLYEGERIAGYAPFTHGVRTVRFAIGEATYYRYRLPCLNLLHEIALRGREETKCDLIARLFDQLALQAKGASAIFLEGIPVDSALHAAVEKLDKEIWVLTPVGEVYEHCFAELPSTFEAYEHDLGARSRQNLRAKKRKLVEHIGAARVYARRFTTEEEVPEFIAQAQAISRRTYQWNLLGLGLRDADALAKRLRIAARHGWLCSFLFYCGEQPVAFMLGYNYHGVYHYIDVGHDPEWSKWSVGTLLQMDVMRDLLSGDGRPDRFDFSTGFGEHKARFGNTTRNEINLLVLPRTFRNVLLSRAYRASLELDRTASYLADKLGIKVWIKKWLRHLA